MDFTAEIARQGFGYLLFVAAVIVLGVREKYHTDEENKKDEMILQLAEKRLQDLKDIKDNDQSNFNKLKDAYLESIDKLKEVINKILFIVEAKKE